MHLSIPEVVKRKQEDIIGDLKKMIKENKELSQELENRNLEIKIL
jgi:hypothetical protein